MEHRTTLWSSLLFSGLLFSIILWKIQCTVMTLITSGPRCLQTPHTRMDHRMWCKPCIPHITLLLSLPAFLLLAKFTTIPVVWLFLPIPKSYLFLPADIIERSLPGDLFLNAQRYSACRSSIPILRKLNTERKEAGSSTNACHLISQRPLKKCLLLTLLFCPHLLHMLAKCRHSNFLLVSTPSWSPIAKL